MNKDNKDEIDSLLAFYEAHMPHDVYLMRNKERYDEIKNAIDTIKQFVSTIESDAEFTISKDELIGTSLCLEVVCTLLSMTEVDKFCVAIKKADSIDITPRADGMLSVVFGFNDAYLPAKPKK